MEIAPTITLTRRTITQEELDAWLDKNFPDLDAAAKAAIKAKFTASGEGGLAGLFTEGEKFGLTAEQIAGILVDTEGMTTEQVQAYLSENFPDLSEAAKNAIVAKLPEGGWQESLKTQLTGMGIAPADIAAILTAQAEGDTDTVESILTEKYAGIKDDAMNAIKAAVPEGGLGASLVSELTDMGIKPADIAAILTAQAEGDTDTVESILTEKYSGIKDQARNAIKAAWEAQVTSGAENGSMNLMADLITEMFTDGVADDQSSVDSMLAGAKEAIDTKIQELRDYIANGGKDSAGAQETITMLENYGQAYEEYATNLAGRSKEECEQAGQALKQLADDCDEALGRILQANGQLMDEYTLRYKAGTQGGELTEQDWNMVSDYLATMDQKRRDAAEEARKAAERAAQEDGKDAAEALAEGQKIYTQKLEEAAKQTASDLAQFVKGQAGDISGQEGNVALLSIWGDVLGLGTSPTVANVQSMLQEKGFDPTTITKALAEALSFGPNGIVDVSALGDFMGTEGLEGLNLSDNIR